jgi:hypothetical protein
MNSACLRTAPPTIQNPKRDDPAVMPPRRITVVAEFGKIDLK